MILANYYEILRETNGSEMIHLMYCILYKYSLKHSERDGGRHNINTRIDLRSQLCTNWLSHEPYCSVVPEMDFVFFVTEFERIK